MVSLVRSSMLLGIIATGLGCYYYYSFWNNLHMGESTVYVPGGGFSGFWYTLGRLQSIPDPYAYQYYCYSAGCLGVVASLQNRSVHDVYTIASTAQRKWLQGDIGRYDVVPEFVDHLLYSDPHLQDAVVQGLPRVHVITTTRGPWGGLSHSIRVSDNVESLREMLLQTTWIPFAVGKGLWHRSHMDGFFSFLWHPQCYYNVGLVANLQLVWNVINIQLSRETVFMLWDLGRLRGF
jgi:hypothetical protein